MRARKKDGSPRTLCRFVRPKSADVLCALDLPLGDLEVRWETSIPPTMWDDDYNFWWMLGKLDWLDKWGRYRGPTYTPQEHKAWGKGEKNWENPKLARLRADPDGFEERLVDGEVVHSPISRLAEQLVTRMDFRREGAPQTDRQRRMQQHALAEYKYRCFAAVEQVEYS